MAYLDCPASARTAHDHLHASPCERYKPTPVDVAHSYSTAVLNWIALLILIVSVSAAIIGRLFVRSRIPEQGWFADPPRAATTLSVVGTMTAVLLAFVIFFSLQSYQHASDGASVEAVAVTELHDVADVLEGHSGRALHGGLICYSRAVISDEWPAMGAGKSSEVVLAWVETIGRDFEGIEPTSAKQEAAYAQWFDQQAQRREGRRARLAEATASVPPPLWFVLGVGAWAVVAYMCLQADRREGRLIQAAPIGLVATLVTSGLLVVFLLDHPYADWSGNIQPTEMRRTLSYIDDGHPAPCDERGNPT